MRIDLDFIGRRLDAYERLLRLDKPIGTLLLLWPTLWAVWLAARGVAYGERIIYSGPVMRQVTKESGALRVWFNHTGAGLATSNATPLMGFRVAGSDGKFFKADARLDGETVIVSSTDVADPSAVRYAWENDPVANLTNKEGLPATPFRTDTWK